MLENTFSTRPAKKGDEKRMAEIEKLSFPRPWSEKAFYDEIVNNNIAIYVVAEADGLVVAYAGVWIVVDEGYITQIAVHPDYRGRGIGEAVVAAMLEEAESRGAASQTLEVRESNLKAQALYRKLGFIPAGLRYGFYEDNGENAVIMWRRP